LINKENNNIKENIVPCNYSTTSNKGNKHLLTWYRKQPFYSKERLNRILEWMGDYKKYLYINQKQIKLLNIGMYDIIHKFDIYLPNGRKQSIYYSNKISNSKMNMLVKKLILEKWEAYINNNWISYKNINYKYNNENKIKNMLERCADFILLNEKSDDRLSSYKKNIIYSIEIPVSCTSDDIQNLFYSLNDIENYSLHKEKEDLINKNNNFIINNKNKNYIKHKETKFDRYMRILDKPEHYTYVMYKLKNKDVYENGNYPKLLDKELEKWENDYFKDLYNKYVYKYKKVKIEKHKRLINPEIPYQSSWCYVYADNVFYFNNRKFIIDKSIYDKQSKMDKILVFKQDNNLYYFNMNINRIDNNYILEKLKQS
jgi:hypothetical protein